MKVITWQDYDLGGERVPSQQKSQFYHTSNIDPVRYIFSAFCAQDAPGDNRIVKLKLTVYSLHTSTLEDFDEIFSHVRKLQGITVAPIVTFDRTPEPCAVKNNVYEFSAPRDKVLAFIEAFRAVAIHYFNSRIWPDGTKYGMGMPTLHILVDGELVDYSKKEDAHMNKFKFYTVQVSRQVSRKDGRSGLSF